MEQPTKATNAEAVLAHFAPLYGHTVPGENVLTYSKWLDLGRQVRKGESGFRIRVVTGKTIDPESDKARTQGRWVSVFHEAQTDVLDPANPAPAPAPRATPTPGPKPSPEPREPLKRDVWAAVARTDRPSGALQRSTSTAKRWREALGAIQSLQCKAAPFPALSGPLAHAETVLKAFEHVTIGTTGRDYFPTSAALASTMWAAARAHHADRAPQTLEVLEPSAGDGALVAEALADGACVHAVEWSSTLADCLTAQFGLRPQFSLERGDFLETSPGTHFDAVIANPPFEKGASAIHCRAALACVAPGGILVCVVGEGAFSGRDAKSVPWFPDWLAEVGAEVTPAPAGSFEGTAAAARIVTVIR